MFETLAAGEVDDGSLANSTQALAGEMECLHPTHDQSLADEGSLRSCAAASEPVFATLAVEPSRFYDELDPELRANLGFGPKRRLSAVSAGLVSARLAPVSQEKCGCPVRGYSFLQKECTCLRGTEIALWSIHLVFQGCRAEDLLSSVPW